MWLVFLVSTILTVAESASSSWLSIGAWEGASGREVGCAQLGGLSAGQRRLCQLYMDHMGRVAAGVHSALQECQYQFRQHRWNCSTAPHDLLGTRESAFVSAITAAGVAYAVSRSCRDGQLSSCSCSRAGRPKDLQNDWIWGGCGDNLEYGYKFTQSFVDVRERENRMRRGVYQQGRALMNLHNNEAGRRAVIKISKVSCKCHGVSGSCSLITCWQQLPSFREIGDYIRDKYDGATEVKVNRRGKLQISDTRFSIPTANDLIYMDDSPNYCIANETVGSLGTQGRSCNRTSHGMDGCNLLCCGRGYNTQKLNQKERCDCKFHWCCEVRCKICVNTVEMHTCK
ncbi:protein Wnt-5b-like isoform X2 [Rhodnius prolixus]